MVRENTKKKFKELMADESFTRQYLELDDPAEMTELFVKNGLDVPEEELKELLEMTIKQLEGVSEELTESQMDEVTGGIGLGAAFAIGAVAAVGVGYFAYRLTAHYNYLFKRKR